MRKVAAPYLRRHNIRENPSESIVSLPGSDKQGHPKCGKHAHHTSTKHGEAIVHTSCSEPEHTKRSCGSAFLPHLKASLAPAAYPTKTNPRFHAHTPRELIRTTARTENASWKTSQSHSSYTKGPTTFRTRGNAEIYRR